MSARTRAYDLWFLVKAGAVLGFIAVSLVACTIGRFM